MIKMFFSVRFQSQLRRTRPRLLRGLEKFAAETITGSGGEVRTEHKLLIGSFDDSSIGFALDMLCVIEKLRGALERAAPELYGHVCVFGRNIEEDNLPLMIRSFPQEAWNAGIWCDKELRKLLQSFVGFEKALSGHDYAAPLQDFAKVKEIHFTGTTEDAPCDDSGKINLYLKQGDLRSTAIVGAEFIGKSEGLRRFCKGRMENFPPLSVRFGGRNAVTCIADSFSPALKAVLTDEDGRKLEELSKLFFRERLRDELSEFLVKRCRIFFTLLLEVYKAAAERENVPPILILEDIQFSDSFARLIITEACGSLPAREKFYLYGTCTDMKSLKPWEELFPRIIKFSPEKKNPPKPPVERVNPEEIPAALWEMAYACALFGRYFPAHLVPRLLFEEGKNPEMIEKSLSLLASFLLVHSVANPVPRFPALVEMAERALGDRAADIQAVVRNRLLAWVETGDLKPCYRLLEAVADLGGTADSALMLEAVYGDVINGTYMRIERAVEDGGFDAVTADASAPLLFIFRTQKALNYGSAEDIRSVFVEGFPSGTEIPDFRAHITANQAAYNIGICDTEAAAGLVKEAMVIAQQENSTRFLGHIYCLFSLVSFSNRQIPDAIDYFAFAVDEAEKSGNISDLAVIKFYSAQAHFILGNISKAERLAVQAEEAAVVSGQSDWADRCWFLRGRLRFEIGCYQESLDIFRALETEYYGKGSSEFRVTVAAWIYRANIYLRNTAVSHEGGTDAKLFELEGAFLSGDYRKTLELADSAGALPRDRFLFIEQPDWRSGFAQCELLLFPLRDLWDRMLLTYRALAMCHMVGAEQHDKDEAIREMRRIMRDELPDTDPNDAFYFYSYYRVLKRIGASEVDMNTAISLAFKRLQRRASRIDDNETKRAFLSLQHWNSALEMTARDHKLI
jgi:tetratricopeptide (TPR) repeat protein